MRRHTKHVSGRGEALRRVGLGLVWTWAAISVPTAAFGATITVQSTADSGGTCLPAPGQPDCTLRQAIADASSADTIDFSVTGVITLMSGALTIGKDLTIDGPGEGQLAVSGNNASKVFIISSGNAVSISELTIQDGDAFGGDGAGINNEGTLTVTNVTLSNNSARNGGGIRNFHSSGTATLEVTNSTFIGNTATNHGAGIMNHGIGTGGTGVVIATSCTFSDNSAVYTGGGIRNMAQSGTATLEVTNSTFSGNTASNIGGGGIYSSNLGSGTATLEVTNSTLSDNSAANGGGIYNGTGTANLKNTILANGTATGSGPDCSGTITSLNYNLVEDTAGCGWTSEAEDITGSDPDLGPLQDNGGPTETMALLGGSPALNTNPQDTSGSPGGGTYNGCPESDQRGYSRASGAGGCPSADCRDIGAYEDEATVVALVFFRVTAARPDGVTLEWQTASEIDNAGFHVWRSDAATGEYTQITEALIPAEGGPTFGAEYAYEDTDVAPGLTYWYELEDIDTHGVSTFHGPIRAEIPPVLCGTMPDAAGFSIFSLFLPLAATILWWMRRQRKKKAVQS